MAMEFQAISSEMVYRDFQDELGIVFEAGGERLGGEASMLWQLLPLCAGLCQPPLWSASLNYGASDSDDECCTLPSGRGYCFIYRYWLVENGSRVIC